jgi:hypothetical protein
MPRPVRLWRKQMDWFGSPYESQQSHPPSVNPHRRHQTHEKRFVNTDSLIFGFPGTPPPVKSRCWLGAHIRMLQCSINPFVYFILEIFP